MNSLSGPPTYPLHHPLNRCPWCYREAREEYPAGKSSRVCGRHHAALLAQIQASLIHKAWKEGRVQPPHMTSPSSTDTDDAAIEAALEQESLTHDLP